MNKYKRVLLKLSGEALMGDSSYGIDPNVLSKYCADIIEIVELGAEVGIVVGGGNIFRGVEGMKKGFDRVKGDYMGMLATVINGLALKSGFEAFNAKSTVFTAINMEPVGIRYSKSAVIEALAKKRIAIFTFGTGNPYFTTDTAAALRGLEIEADALLKGTRVDGVYSTDPEQDKDAIKYDEISFDEAYSKQLKIMDLTAFTMCKENDLPIIVFNMNESGSLKKIILGEKIGTLVKN